MIISTKAYRRALDEEFNRGVKFGKEYKNFATATTSSGIAVVPQSFSIIKEDTEFQYCPYCGKKLPKGDN